MPLLDPLMSLPDAPQACQACSEACPAFQRLPQEGWSTYGLCTNPVSPLRGFPVRVGRDCRYFGPGPGRREK